MKALLLSLSLIILTGCEAVKPSDVIFGNIGAEKQVQAEKEEFKPYWMITFYPGGNFSGRRWSSWERPNVSNNGGVVQLDNGTILTGNIIIEKITKEPNE